MFARFESHVADDHAHRGVRRSPHTSVEDRFMGLTNTALPHDIARTFAVLVVAEVVRRSRRGAQRPRDRGTPADERSARRAGELTVRCRNGGDFRRGFQLRGAVMGSLCQGPRAGLARDRSDPPSHVGTADSARDDARGSEPRAACVRREHRRLHLVARRQSGLHRRTNRSGRSTVSRQHSPAVLSARS